MPQSDVDAWAAAGVKALQQTQTEQVRNSLSQALPVNPDKEAELRRYANAAQVPLDTARNMPDEVKQQAQMSTFDAERLTQDFPNTARWLGVPDNAKLVHDVIPQTTQIEKAVTGLTPTAPPLKPVPTGLDYIFDRSGVSQLDKDLKSGFGQSLAGGAAFLSLVAGVAPMAYDFIKGGTTAQDWWFRNMVDHYKNIQESLEMDPRADFHRKAIHGAGSLLGTLAQIAMTGGASAETQAAPMVAQGSKAVGEVVKAAFEHGGKAMAFPALSDAVNMARKVYEATNSPLNALNAGIAQWFNTSAMGAAPLSMPGGLPTRLATGAVSGVATGEISRQTMNSVLPDKMGAKFDWEQALLNALSGTMLAGVMGPREAAGLTPFVSQAYREAYKQAQTEHQNQQVIDLAKLATASELRKRDPLAFKDFVKSTAEDGSLPGVYIEAHKLAEVLQQHEISADELRQTMPEVAAQLDAALGENAPKNGLVSIPIEDFATHIAGSELEGELMQHLRVDPEGGTVTESKAFAQDQVKEMGARAEAISAERENDQAYQDSLNQMNAMVDQNMAGLKMRPDQLETNSTLLRAYYQVRADQHGVLPHEFARDNPVYGTTRVTDEVGASLAQLAPKAKPGPDSPGAGTTPENKLGFWPALRVKLTGKLKLPDKPPILTGTNNKNAQRQIDAIDGILKKFPNATDSPADWTKMMAHALGSDEVPIPPYAFIRDLNGPGSLDKLRTLTQGQIDDATHGFENAAEFRRAYVAGELGVETTGKLFMWSFLSRGVSPYTQEALFIDAFKGADKWIKQAAEGKFTEADFDAYEAWAKSVAPQGSGQPGAGATHNLNAFGKNFLFRMGQTNKDGITSLQRLHNLMSDPTQTGRSIRREFATFGESVGIDNKVVSFTLLVAGHADVMVLDRVQIRQLWDDGRFKGVNLYDGSNGPDGKKLAGSSLNSLAEGARGILVYEAIERGLEAKIKSVYTELGRPQDASIGRYHWETWVADSQQEASHGTLGAILTDAKGDDLAISNVAAKQGEYGAYEYGALYNRDADGTPWFGYDTPTGGHYEFSVPAFRAFLADIKKPAEGVVPTKFKVTESGNGPWYARPEVNQQKLDERARYWADRAGGSGEGQRAAEQAVRDQAAADSAGPATGRGADGNPEELNQKQIGAFSPSTHTIALLKGANLSTFQHELGHFFLDNTAHLAAQPNAPESLKKDMAVLLNWFGIHDTREQSALDAWHTMSLDEQRASHEKFATAWETYLMKGQAPSLELRTIFQRLRSWMIEVYKSLKGAPGEFTPEVRGVFDRMIASEAAIHEAELARKYMPLFDSPEKSGMSAEEWAAYQATGKEATEQAIEKLIGKTMSDMAWMGRLRTASLKSVEKDAAEKRKLIQRDVRAEVMAQPVYRAWAFLTGKDTTALPDEINAEHKEAVRVWSDARDTFERETKAAKRLEAWEASDESKQTHEHNGLAKGQFLAKNRARIDLDVQRAMLEYDAEHPKPKAPEKPAGNTDPTVGAGKISTDALKSLDKAAYTKLSALRMTSGKGLEPGVLADMFGFADGTELVKALTEAEHPRDVVQAITDQRMLEAHGELSSPDAIRATADQLVQNEVRARFVATELKALRDSIGKGVKGKPNAIVAAAKEAAANTIDTKRIRDISERQFTAAETRSGAQAEKAMSKGDTEGAAVAKRDQLLNMELARAARDAQEYVQKALKYLAKFDKSSVRESIDLDYRDQIDALLARADLRKGVSNAALNKREALAAFVERMAEQGYKPEIPEHLLNELDTWHYKDMPLVAFRGLVDSIKSIEQLGRLKTELRDKQETRALNEVADEAAASAAKLPQREKESNRGLTRMQANWLKAKSYGRSVESGLLKMEQMMDWLDARNPLGAFNRRFRSLADAGIKKADMQAVVKAEFDKLIKANLADIIKDGGKIYTADGLIDKATGLPQKFTVKEMLMLAGNYGNDSNLQKLAKGEGWDPVQVKAFLDANMTKGHWDYVAGLAKAVESLWPEKLDMYRRLGKTSPPKVEARAFDTPHGTYPGWYWPMMYDPVRNQDVADRGAKRADELFENTYARANTDTGRMNTRNEAYASAILLDLDAMPRMINDEIHDIAYREAVIDADKFFSHPTVREAIVNALSQEHYNQIRPWLQAIANDGKSTEGSRALVFFNAIAREARTRATMVGLGFRLTTAIVHGTSAGVESVAELGAKWMGSGLADFKNPLQWEANRAFIFERSGEMRNRANEVDRDIREHLREIDIHLMDTTTSAMERGKDMMRARAYSLIGMLDMASALPTWLGAYKKGLTPLERGGLGLSEQDAIYFADKTVRNAHGGTGVKDMAAIQRGQEFQKLFTMFYTFWNHNFNRIVDTGKLVVSAEHRAMMKEANHWTNTELATTVILRTLAYTIGVQVLHSLLHPPKEGEGEVSWLKWAAKELASAAFAGIPIARDLSAHYITGKPYSATPSASLVDMVGRTGMDAANALQGKQVSDKWLKHTITTAGAALNLPLGQPASTVQFLWDVAAGHQHPENAKDWWNGVLHGETKQH